jgi:hypothetical protein
MNWRFCLTEKGDEHPRGRISARNGLATDGAGTLPNSKVPVVTLGPRVRSGATCEMGKGQEGEKAA